MNATQITACLLLVSVAASGCRSQLPRDMTACDEPRPEVCTHDYRPVCGYMPGEDRWKQFGNGCTACSDPAVAGWRAGPCGEN